MKLKLLFAGFLSQKIIYKAKLTASSQLNIESVDNLQNALWILKKKSHYMPCQRVIIYEKKSLYSAADRPRPSLKKTRRGYTHVQVTRCRQYDQTCKSFHHAQ